MVICFASVGMSLFACGRLGFGKAATPDDQPDADNPIQDAAGFWCQPAADTVFVHASLGADSNAGTCDSPLRSITRALSITDSISAIAIIRIAGSGSANNPLVYSSADTGEVFPLNIDFRSKDISLIGSGSVSIRGGGAAPLDVAVVVSSPNRNVVIDNVNIQGTNHGVSVINGKLSLLRASITDSGGDGLSVIRDAGKNLAGTALVQDSVFARNGSALSGNSLQIEFLRTVVRDSRGSGVFLYNEGYLASTSSTYLKNTGSGIQLAHNSNVLSNLDVFDGNRDGVSMYDPANGGTGLVGNGSRFVNQLGSGVSLGYSFNVKLRGCTLLGNAEHGVFIGNDARADATLDLGTAAEPGGNTLQATVGGNIGAGVCNQSSLTIPAQRNNFSRCTPSLAASCVNGIDVAGPVTASCF
jgi:hypothetical protein